MRRISRIQRPIGLLRKQSSGRIPSPYLCLACKHQTTSFSTSAPVTVPSKVPYTEKLRQRIWGTDKPPGQEDPYGDASVFDQSKKRAPRQELEARAQEPEGEVEVEENEPEDFTDEGYEPATSIEGLKVYGGDLAWLPEEDFAGFSRPHPVDNPAQITGALHRAMVETFSLQQAGYPSYMVSALPIWDESRWTENAHLIPSVTGATLRMEDLSSLRKAVESLRAKSIDEENNGFEPAESLEHVFADRLEVDTLKEDEVGPIPDPHDSNFGQGDPTESKIDVTADRYEEDRWVKMEEGWPWQDIIASWDPAWLQISLENPEVKFAVLKRTFQLTGIRIPDSAIKSSNTAKSLLHHLVTPPKPRKLYEALEQKGDLFELGNVAIHPKRYGFIAKEMDTGRLKTIVAELDARGLPVSHKEREELGKIGKH